MNKIRLNKLNEGVESLIKFESKQAALIEKYIELSGEENEFTERASKVNTEYQKLKRK